VSAGGLDTGGEDARSACLVEDGVSGVLVAGVARGFEACWLVGMGLEGAAVSSLGVGRLLGILLLVEAASDVGKSSGLGRAVGGAGRGVEHGTSITTTGSWVGRESAGIVLAEV